MKKLAIWGLALLCVVICASALAEETEMTGGFVSIGIGTSVDETEPQISPQRTSPPPILGEDSQNELEYSDEQPGSKRSVPANPTTAPVPTNEPESADTTDSSTTLWLFRVIMDVLAALRFVLSFICCGWPWLI